MYDMAGNGRGQDEKSELCANSLHRFFSVHSAHGFSHLGEKAHKSVLDLNEGTRLGISLKHNIRYFYCCVHITPPHPDGDARLD